MINGKRILVALDDGHGIDTAGKRTPILPNKQTSEIGRNYMNENVFNRAVVKYLKEELEYIGFDTLLVAPTDVDTPLELRTKLANDRKADIYISVHANAITGQWGTWGGIETFYYPSVNSRRLSSIIHKQVMKGTAMKDRGIKNGSHLWVLRKANMPATLLELGFMDSLLDYKELLKDTYRRECATEIAMGVCEYFDVKYKARTQKEEEVVPVSNPVKPSVPVQPKPSPATPTNRPFLKKGATGNAVRDLQIRLIKHYIKVESDGHFGDLTEDAVKKFQEQKKLKVDGLVGDSTWAELMKAPAAVVKPEPKPEPKPVPHIFIKNGDSGAMVKELQTLLVKHNIIVKVDGHFGDLTEGAVRKFQTLKKLEVDGLVGEKTWIELLKKPVVQPKPAPKPEPKPEPKPVVTPAPKPVSDCGCDHDCDCKHKDAPKPESKPQPKPAPKPNDLNDGVLFKVVAGSFEDMKEANERVAFLKSKGISSFVSPYKDGGKMHYRVMAGTFDARDNAEAMKEKLAKLKVDSFLLAVKK